MSAHKQVRLSDITAGLIRAIPDAPVFLQGLRTMINAGPDKKMSIGLLLEKQASRYPAAPAVKFEDQTWSYASFNGWVNRIAALFQSFGVGEGDVVAIMSENRPEMLACTAAAVKLGAIAGMINYNQRDEVLVHSLGLIKPKVMVVGAESVEAVDATEYSPLSHQGLRHLWIGSESEDCPLGYENLAEVTETLPSANPGTTAQVRTQQPCFYIFTSGTTGMPKASVMSHSRWLKGGAGMGLLTARLTRRDTLYVPLPLYHNNALTVSWGSALASGACLALTRRFSVSRFWEEARQHGATAFCYIGELCRYLLNQEASPQDRAHNVRVVIGNGLRPEIWMEFKTRFGIDRVCEFYGASECNLAFVNSFDVDCTAGFCPLPFAVVACDPETEEPVRDAKGRMRRVSTGEVGLLITKISRLAPFDGYTDASASEKKLFHHVFKDEDCWFNTGDLVRDQGFKHIQFVDRLGDTFRWKGENVATTEVEAAFKHIEQIEQAVVYGVQVPNADGRAGMAAITLNDALKAFDGGELAQRLMGVLPAYAVPLFVRIRGEHEITGTFKNRKVELKKEGFDPTQSPDPVFMLDAKAGAYIPLTQEGFQQLQSGSIRL